MFVLDNANLMPLWIILGLLGFFGLIVIGVIIVKRHVAPLQIKKDEMSEEEAIQEELNRILVPIEDEKVAKQMMESNKENPSKDEDKK